MQPYQNLAKAEIVSDIFFQTFLITAVIQIVKGAFYFFRRIINAVKLLELEELCLVLKENQDENTECQNA